MFDFALPRRRLGPPDVVHTTLWSLKPVQPPFRYYLDLFILRCVSHDWDRDICGTPSFWQVMSFLFRPRFQQLIWSRSGESALDMELGKRRPYWDSGNGAWTKKEIAYLDQMLQRGLRELYLEVSTTTDLPSSFLSAEHPRLRALSIIRDSSLQVTTPIIAPHLADLFLVNCTLSWDNLTKLRSLVLHGAQCPTLRQLVRILVASPFLEALELTGCKLHQDSADDAPQDPLSMKYLTKLELERIPWRITSGLLNRLVVTSSVCSTFITVDIDEHADFDIPWICKHVGGLCGSFPDAGDPPKACLNISRHSLSFGLGGKSYLSLRKRGWSEHEGTAEFPQRAQMIRLFLTEATKSNEESFKDPVNQSHAWFDSVSSSLEGIQVINDFFPHTQELDIAMETGIEGVVQALTETKPTQNSQSQWPLPRLSKLDIKQWGHQSAWDGLIDTLVKRTQAAALPLSTVSPITELSLGHGAIRKDNISKLEEIGINPASLLNVEDYDKLLAINAFAGKDDQEITAIKRMRNALLPVSGLPREIRLNIFHLALPHRRLGPPDYLEYPNMRQPTRPPFRYYFSLFIIRKVSHDWDHEICGTPSFWTLMSARFPPPLRDLVWSRSGQLPLDVELGKDIPTSSLESSMRWSEQDRVYLDQVIRRGLRELYLEAGYRPEAASSLLNVQHPQLRKLSILRDMPLQITTPIIAPHLADLLLVNCSLSWDSLTGLTKLRSLILSETHCPTLAQLLGILNGSPSLEVLQLTFCKYGQESIEDIPQSSLSARYLTRLVLDRIPWEVTSGLIDRLVTSPICSTSIAVEVGKHGDIPLFCKQAGRLYGSFPDVDQLPRVHVNIWFDSFSLRLGRNSYLSLYKPGWKEQEGNPRFPQRAQMIRLFLSQVNKASLESLEDTIDQAHGWFDAVSLSFEGLQVINDFFPQTRKLEMTLDSAINGVVQALMEVQGVETSSSQWLLPRLTELNIKQSFRVHWDGLADLLLKRTHAAALPLSTVSPITELRLDQGVMRYDSLFKLKEAGIKCVFESVEIKDKPDDRIQRVSL
ncbi:hypothetical protein FRB90_000020 [Tulasnella sp. 427]|nr:hypothetical protein FRB90_000020 [Tulasnella sp. 427]